MKRREFITLLGGTAAAWPLAARRRRPSGCGESVSHVATIDPAQLVQALQERRDAGLKFRIVRGCGYEHG